MSKWEDFSRNIVDESSLRFKRKPIKSNPELDKAFRNKLFGTGEPTRVTRKIGKDDGYFLKIFQGFMEIESSYRTLRDIEVYISSHPYRNKQITKPRYLRYNIESYFNEVYILKERLISYLTSVGRTFKGDKRHAIVLLKTKPLFTFVNNSLKGVINTRGSHVHYRRFDHDDLDRLDTMDLLVSTATEGIWKDFDWYYNDTYRQLRTKWKKTIKNNNDQTLKLLDAYGEILNEILFNISTGRLKYPRISLTKSSSGRKKHAA